MSPFQLVYGAEVVFPVYLGFPIIIPLQEQEEEPNHMQRRIHQIIELNEVRDKDYDKVQVHQEKMKITFDMKVKEEQFQVDDLVLKWDARKEDKYGKFDHLWKGPYIIVAFRVDNSFILKHQNRVQLKGGPGNGIFLKHYLS